MRLAMVLSAAALSSCIGSITPGTPASASPSPRPRTLERSDLASVFASSAALTFRVRYSVNGAINGQAISGNWVTYQKPPDRRVDVSYGSVGFYDSETVYLHEKTAVVCPLPLTGACVSTTDASVIAAVDGLDAPIRADLTFFDSAELQEDRIAGQPVTCFRIRPDAKGKLDPGARQFDVCYTGDGVPLRIEIRAPNLDLELEALILIREVADADVQIPKPSNAP